MPQKILCHRVSDKQLKLHSSDSSVRQCIKCGEDVWSSAATLIQAGGDAELICMACMPKATANEENVKVRVPSQHVIDTVNKALEASGSSNRLSLDDLPGFLAHLKLHGIVPLNAILVEDSYESKE